MSILLHRILSFGWDQRRWCEQIISEVKTDLGGDAEFGWGQGGSKGEAGEKHSDLVLRLLVASVPHPVEEPDGNAFGCDGGLGVESPVGFFDVYFVAQDPLVWVGPTKVVYEV